MDEHQKPSWVEYFMSLAFGACMRSKDPKTQVGCVIVDSETLKILSIGYNGFPPGISNTVENWSDKRKKDLVVHAETNAVLLKGGANLENSIAFATLFPCVDCAKILIQAGVCKVYYLSFRDKYGKSKEIFNAAKVEYVPVNREEDGTLTAFQNRFINMFKATIQNVNDFSEIDESTRELYDQLKKDTKALREKDIESPWPRDLKSGQRSDLLSCVEYFTSWIGLPWVFDVFRRSKDPKPEILFKQWKDYFLFLALIAGIRSSSDPKEGALLLDSKTFKICSLSYKGFPRGVDLDETPNDAMMVSAIMNVLALRFCEGNSFYAFSTNFPKEGEVKNLAQAKVKRLYFINPTNMTDKALSTLEAAGVETVPMNLLERKKDKEEEIGKTFQGLKDKESKIPFKQWPKIQGTPYELEPKRRNSGLQGLATIKNIVDERVVRNETRKFEAEHEECVRVLPYQLENGDIEIHLYVYGDKSGIPTKLEKAAQTFFGQYGWKLQWKDLYNDAFNVLQVTSIECSSGQPKRLEAYQVDEIEDTISKHLHIFSNHRNVTAVQPFFKVTKSIQTEEACIVVYVLGKGQIPMGEKAIPPAIGPYRVDIVNGFCVRTKDPYMPIEAHKQKDFLRLGASIGVYGKQSSGTLGAIVEDENSGTLYALSCDHVMRDADESEIIHPGFDVYLNCLRFNLNGYKDWINRITGLDLQLPAISDDSTDEAELQNIFENLREMHVDLEGSSNSAEEQITIFERNLEEAFRKRPRVIASYSAGVRRNVCSEMSDREHFIDAAISELDENEVKNVKAEKFLQICDTTHYPSGNCILATTKETMNVEEVFKSGSATGFTESRLILGSSQSLPTFIQDFRRNGDCAWIDVDCINCKKRRTAQTQVQEWTDPCEQCQEHSGWLKSCLSIQQHGSKPFSDKGDSGAVIFEKRRKEKGNEYQLPSDGFGIIFAELPTQIGIFAIASPLETALKALSQKVSESRPDSEPCQLRLASSFR